MDLNLGLGFGLFYYGYEYVCLCLHADLFKRAHHGPGPGGFKPSCGC